MGIVRGSSLKNESLGIALLGPSENQSLHELPEIVKEWSSHMVDFDMPVETKRWPYCSPGSHIEAIVIKSVSPVQYTTPTVTGGEDDSVSELIGIRGLTEKFLNFFQH